MRTATDIYEDLIARERSPEQIRIVALARGETELLKLAEDAMAEKNKHGVVSDAETEWVDFDGKGSGGGVSVFEREDGEWGYATKWNLGASGSSEPLTDMSDTAPTRVGALADGFEKIYHAVRKERKSKRQTAALKILSERIDYLRAEEEGEREMREADREAKVSPRQATVAASAEDALSDRVAEVPVDEIQPSPENRHLSDDDPELGPLCASLESEGLIQPVVLRRILGGDDAYEIVCGERRWRAARKLGWERIPAIVRDELTDEEAQVLRLTENLQRVDVPPLEQSEGVAILLERYGEPEEVAKRLGQTPDWVRTRARLRNLSEAWRAELADPETAYGPLASYVGWQEQLAKLPRETQDFLWTNRALIACRTEADLVRRIGEWLRRIEDAPWPKALDKKIPKGERCATCQKRSDREPTLFRDIVQPGKPGAACLDPACWDRKVDLWLRNMIRDAREQHPGLVVLLAEYYISLPASLREALDGIPVVTQQYWFEDRENISGDFEERPGLFLTGSRRGEILETVYVRRLDEEEDSDEGQETQDSEEVERARKEREENEQYVARVAERVAVMGYDDLPEHDTALILLRLCAIYGCEPSGERERIDGIPANQVSYDVWIGVREMLKESLYCAECRADAEYVAAMLGIDLAEIE